MFDPSSIMHVHSSVDDAGLDPYEFRLYGRISRRWSEDRGCDESVPNMAAACGMNVKTAQKAIAKLERRRFIARTPRPGKTDRFDPLPPGEWQDDPGPASRPRGNHGQGKSEPQGTPRSGGTSTPESGVPPDQGTPKSGGRVPPNQEVPVPPNQGDKGIPIEGSPIREDVDEDARTREERSWATQIEELPDDQQRFRRQIEALQRADPDARRQRAYQALRAGAMPAAELAAELCTAEARAGPLAVTAALVVTANTARARYPDQRLAFFRTVLDTITDHVYRTRIGTDEPPVGDLDGDPPGGGHANGYAPGGRRRGGPAEIHTFDGARRIADRAMQRYDELFGDERSIGDAPGDGGSGGGAGGDPGDH